MNVRVACVRHKVPDVPSPAGRKRAHFASFPVTKIFVMAANLATVKENAKAALLIKPVTHILSIYLIVVFPPLFLLNSSSSIFFLKYFLEQSSP